LSGCADTQRCAIDVLASVDPSSQSNNSKSGMVWAMTLSIASSMNCSASKKIMMTVTAGARVITAVLPAGKSWLPDRRDGP
jgi:hypothetical protein